MPLATTPRPKPGARKPVQDPDDFRAPLHVHLDELRNRLLRSLAAVVVAWIVAWPLAKWVNQLIIERALTAVVKNAPDGTRVAPMFTNATEPFMTLLRQSFIIGLCVALPFVLVQIWGFVEPGLKESEKRPVKRALPFSVLLFFVGVAFCWLILPEAFGWFAGFLGDFPGAGLNQNPEQLVTFAVKMMAAFGVCFQLPLIVFILGKVGILSPDTLIRYWRQATVAIFFIAAAITPSNDPASMLMMAIPLCVLFIVSVYAVKLTQRGKSDEESELPPLD